MNRIRELRKARGWQQADLAKLIAVSRQAVGNYETGERAPDLDTIDQLCTIFGVTADYLLGRSDVPVAQISAEEWRLVESFRRLSAPGREYVLHSVALAELAHTEKNGAVPELETAVNDAAPGGTK